MLPDDIQSPIFIVFFDTKFIYYYTFNTYILYQLCYIKYNDILINVYLNYNNIVQNNLIIIIIMYSIIIK